MLSRAWVRERYPQPKLMLQAAGGGSDLHPNPVFPSAPQPPLWCPPAPPALRPFHLCTPSPLAPVTPTGGSGPRAVDRSSSPVLSVTPHPVPFVPQALQPRSAPTRTPGPPVGRPPMPLMPPAPCQRLSSPWLLSPNALPSRAALPHSTSAVPPAPLTCVLRLAGGLRAPPPSVTRVQLSHVGSGDKEGPSPVGLASPSHLPPVLVGFVEQQELLASSHGHLPPVLSTVRVVVQGTDNHGRLGTPPLPPLPAPPPRQHPRPAQGARAHSGLVRTVCRTQNGGSEQTCPVAGMTVVAPWVPAGTLTAGPGLNRQSCAPWPPVAFSHGSAPCPGCGPQAECVPRPWQCPPTRGNAPQQTCPQAVEGPRVAPDPGAGAANAWSRDTGHWGDQEDPRARER